MSGAAGTRWFAPIAAFDKPYRVRKLLPLAERMEMENAVAADPEAHPVVPGTKGVRKARWARPGTGKRGGVRLIYDSRTQPSSVVLITVCAKNEKENLSDAGKKEIRKVVASLTGAN